MLYRQDEYLQHLFYCKCKSYRHRTISNSSILLLCLTVLFCRCNPRCCVVICEGMGLLERIVQRSKQKKERDLRTAYQAGAGETDASIGTGTGAGTGIGAGPRSDEGVSAEPSDQLDFLFIDADSKDSSLGLSAPPKSFITASALRTLFDGKHPLYFFLSLFPSSLQTPLSYSLSSSPPLFFVFIFQVQSPLTFWILLFDS